MEKLLLEATLELIDTGIVVGMQDMGAAGLTSSTVETAERGEGGIVIDIARVPRREEGMHPYEVMLSESQERMLVIVRKGEEDRAREIFQKWDLHAVNIGQVIADNMFVVQDNGTTVARIPVDALTSDAPVYHREMREPRYLKQAQELDLTLVPVQQDYSQVTVELLSSVNLNRKSWVYEQYDHMVGTNTVLLPGADGAVIRLKHTDKALAMSCDGNGRYCYLDPYEGGKSAVAESARNVVCVGAQPTAITNCLNFGTPTDPEIFWQFTRCVEGITEACRVLGTPVTGGNVSFYNENPDGAIDPTPVIGMLGIIENINMLCTPEFKQEGDIVAIIGNGTETLGGSEYPVSYTHLRAHET